MDIEELKETHKSIKSDLEKKLKEFEGGFNQSDEHIFLELCFCILAAGTSARLALNTVERIKGIVFSADADKLQKALKESRYRFHTVRAEYLASTRDYLIRDCGFHLKEKIKSFKDALLLREYFAETKNIRGIGYKESSHFLRNIGLNGYAILDKHIVNSLFELGVIKDNKRPSNKKRYLEIEAAMKAFAKSVNIDFDELDLLLWRSKTGELIK